MQILNRSIFILSILGLVVSAYLAYEYSLGGSINCPLTGIGCDLVRQSQYSSLLGIQIPYFGILFYLGLAFLSIWLTQNFNKLIFNLRLIISIFGFAFGIYLTILEAFVIYAFCIWCLTSFFISAVIVLLCIIRNHEN